MSYSVEDGQVVLRMSPKDFETLLVSLGYYTAGVYQRGGKSAAAEMFLLLNRLNEGNPNYTPSQVKT